MELAKPCLDIGVQTNQREAMLRFWGEEIGLDYEELLKVGGGMHQHRHGLNGSVFKLNHVRDPLPVDDRTGYQGLLIARDDVDVPGMQIDPDGNRVSLVPPGHRGITRIGIAMTVSSIERFRHFYRDVLGIEEIDGETFRWGTTILLLTEDPAHRPCRGLSGTGYRYITVQVRDVEREHAAICGRGGIEARAPVTLGRTARISFITDPDGNWIEISQRASLTGALPGEAAENRQDPG